MAPHVWTQWARAKPRGVERLDAGAQWRGAPKKPHRNQPKPSDDSHLDNSAGWVRYVNAYGVVFKGWDHYCVRDLPASDDGAVLEVEVWNDAVDRTHNDARVWRFWPLTWDNSIAVDHGGWYNTKYTVECYSDNPNARHRWLDADEQGNPHQPTPLHQTGVQGCTYVGTWADYLDRRGGPPSYADEDVRHGVWTTDPKDQEHEDKRSDDWGFRDWHDGVPETHKETQGNRTRLKSPPGPKYKSIVLYLSPSAQSHAAHTADWEDVFISYLSGSSATQESNNFTTNDERIAWTWLTGSVTAQGDPASADWDEDYTSGYEVQGQIDVDQAGSGITYGFRTVSSTAGHCARVTSGGTEAETKAMTTPVMSGTGFKSFTFGTVTWGTGATTDDFSLCLAVARDDTSHGNLTVIIGSLRTSDSWVRGPWRRYTQSGFRGYEDDGTTLSTYDATAIDVLNANFTRDTADPFVLWFGCTENPATMATADRFRLQYKKNAGSWTALSTTSSNIKAVTHSQSYWVDGADAPDVLSLGSGYLTENNAIDEDGEVVCSADWGSGTASVANTINTAWSLEIIDADVADNDTIEVRQVLWDNDTSTAVPFRLYTQTPTITVNKPTGNIEFASTSTGTGTLTAEVNRGILGATGSGVSTLTAEVNTGILGAQADGVSTCTAALTVYNSLGQANLDGAGTLDALMTRGLTAQADGVSTLTAEVNTGILGAQADGVSTLDAEVNTGLLGAQADGSGSMSASLSVQTPIQGAQADGLGSLDAEVNTGILGASAAGASTLAAEVNTGLLGAQADGVSTCTAVLTVETYIQFTSQSDGASTLAAELNTGIIGAQADGSSTLAAEVNTGLLGASVAGVSTLSATMAVYDVFTAQSDGAATLSATLTLPFVAQLDGVGTCSAILTVQTDDVEFTAQLDGVGTLSSELNTGILGASLDGASTLAAELNTGILGASAAGVSSLSATWYVDQFVSAAITRGLSMLVTTTAAGDLFHDISIDVNRDDPASAVNTYSASTQFASVAAFSIYDFALDFVAWLADAGRAWGGAGLTFSWNFTDVSDGGRLGVLFTSSDAMDWKANNTATENILGAANGTITGTEWGTADADFAEGTVNADFHVRNYARRVEADGPFSLVGAWHPDAQPVAPRRCNVAASLTHGQAVALAHAIRISASPRYAWVYHHARSAWRKLAIADPEVERGIELYNATFAGVEV